MPIEATASPGRELTHPLAARRILRLALGVALSLGFSQAIGWQLSFIAPVLTLLILGLPLPAPGLKQGVVFVVALLAPMLGGLALLPFLEHARWVGILLMTMALFYSFYFTAKGGAAVVGTFMTVGLTLVVTIGSVNSEILIALIQALALNACFGIAFVWIAHALLPDLPPDPAAVARRPPAKPKPELAEARREAFRSLLIVLPMALLFLFMSGSTSYTVIMIKVASMGQQATADNSRAMAKSFLTSTAWGGVGALIAWTLLSIWPSLILYVLLVGLAGLVFGRGIFQGPAVHPQFSTWSYAFMTMVIILGPAVLDSPSSGGSGTAILWRLFLFVLIAIYGSVAVAVFDAFWPRSRGGARSE